MTALTSKDQMKTMVSDLEKEIWEMLQVLKTNENERIKLEEGANSKVKKATNEIEELNKKISILTKEVDTEKLKLNQVNSEKDELNKTISKLRESMDKISGEKSILQKEIDKLSKDKTKLTNDNKSLDEEISKLTTLKQKTTYLEQSVADKEKELKKLKDENSKINSEVFIICKLTVLFKLKRLFVLQIEKERLQLKYLQSDQEKWEEERKKLNKKIENLTTKINTLENSIEQKDKLVKELVSLALNDRVTPISRICIF